MAFDVDAAAAERRAEIVAIVKAAVADIDAVRSGQHRIQVYPGARALQLTFVLEGGREMLGTFLVPLHPRVLRTVHSKTLNPYNAVTVDVRPVMDVPASMLELVEPDGDER